VKPVLATTLLRLLTSLAFLAYPFAVYFLLNRVGAGGLGILLVLILLVRYSSVVKSKPWLLIFGLVVGVMFILLQPAYSEQLLRFYPTLINVCLLSFFGFSLVRPPSIIARIASASGTVVTESVRRYTDRVTLIWCGFFAVNIFVSAAIAVSGSMQTWAFYNGFLSYLIMGVIFVGEYIYRRFYISKNIVGDV
jgi:uncharacterized membrane protein